MSKKRTKRVTNKGARSTMKTFKPGPEHEAMYDARYAAAALVDREFSNRWFAELNLLHLQEIGEIGLPDCYDTAEDFLYDFWPNLPWNGSDQRAVALIMLADPRWRTVAAAVRASVGLDMQAELEQVITEEDEA